MSKHSYKIWEPTDGETEEDACQIEAPDIEAAFEQWAKDSDMDEYLLRGNHLVIRVRDEHGKTTDLRITGEAEVVYSYDPITIDTPPSPGEDGTEKPCDYFETKGAGWIGSVRARDRMLIRTESARKAAERWAALTDLKIDGSPIASRGETCRVHVYDQRGQFSSWIVTGRIERTDCNEWEPVYTASPVDLTEVAA